MRRHSCILPIALSALALTGCVESKPAPRLSSPDRYERIEAVRTALGQYGARPAAPPVPAAEQSAIVGRWNHPWGTAAYYQFNADGTARRVTLLTSDEGTYRFQSKDVIEFNFPRARVAPHEEVSFHLRGDTLELCMLGGAWIHYQKAK
jgi:hypothetical protein